MQPAVSTALCPHCGAANPAGSAFCESCGKALPAGAPTTPRLVTGDAVATTGVGFNLQTEELHKQAKKAAGALLAVAIIMTVVAGFYFVVANNARSATVEINYVVVVLQGVLAAVFWGLYFWARSQPLPPAIVGLVLYGTLVVLNVVTAISAMNAGGERRGGFGGIGIGWLDIIIIAVLVQSIQAGTKYRKLMRSASGGGSPIA